LQIELSRRLYMDENTLAPLPGGFEKTREFCRDLVETLAALPADRLNA
jgi:N-formylglutamate amidohydrolase